MPQAYQKLGGKFIFWNFSVERTGSKVYLCFIQRVPLFLLRKRASCNIFILSGIKMSHLSDTRASKGIRPELLKEQTRDEVISLFHISFTALKQQPLKDLFQKCNKLRSSLNIYNMPAKRQVFEIQCFMLIEPAERNVAFIRFAEMRYDIFRIG